MSPKSPNWQKVAKMAKNAKLGHLCLRCWRLAQGPKGPELVYYNLALLKSTAIYNINLLQFTSRHYNLHQLTSIYTDFNLHRLTVCVPAITAVSITYFFILSHVGFFMFGVIPLKLCGYLTRAVVDGACTVLQSISN